MDTNTDPVRAHDELRVQAALLRTPEFIAQFDPDKFAGQLERIAAAIASAPPSAPVGVDWPTIVEGLREADRFFDGDDRYSPHASKVRAAYRAALAAQHGCRADG